MNIDEIKEFLNTEEGKLLAEELKSPLVAKRDELLGEVKKHKTEAETYKQQIERIQQEAAEKLNREKEAQLRANQDWDALKAHYEKQVAELTGNLGNIRQSLAKKEQEKLLAEVSTKEAVVPKALQAILKERTKAEIVDDEIQVTVLDAKGGVAYVNGRPATVNDLIEELRIDPEFQPLFKGNGSTGSGAKQSDKRPGTVYDMSSPGFNLTKAATKGFAKR